MKNLKERGSGVRPRVLFGHIALLRGRLCVLFLDGGLAVLVELWFRYHAGHSTRANTHVTTNVTSTSIKRNNAKTCSRYPTTGLSCVPDEVVEVDTHADPLNVAAMVCTLTVTPPAIEKAWRVRAKTC